MAQAMWILEGNAQTAFLYQGEQSMVKGMRFQNAAGGLHSQEDPAIRGWGWSSLQMFHQRTGDFIGQRQFQKMMKSYSGGFADGPVSNECHRG